MIQPPLTPSQVSAVQKLVNQIAYEGLGPVATPKLLLLIEDFPTGDIVGLLYPAIAEDMTYRGICSVLAEAWETLEDEPQKRLARLNLVRVHLGRTNLTSGNVARRALENAAATLDSLPARGQDWELIELKADIAVQRAKYADAIAAYKRIPMTTRPYGEIQAKIGATLRLDGRLDESLNVLQSAVRRESGNTIEHVRSWHELQQEQGLTLVAKGDVSGAGTCLTSSAKLSKSSVFSPRIDLAIALTKRGHLGVVKTYIAMISTWNSNISESAMTKAIQQ
jgi:tetratricopeptide (TPR) repeat protein